MDNLNIGVKPINAAGPASPWAYWSCAEGTLVGTTTNKLVNRAWGPGRVAVPDLTFKGTVGTMWTATPGRCDLQDGGGAANKYFSADLDPVTAAAFSCAGSGVILVWAHFAYRTDATDTGAHTLLQVGGGGNNRDGFTLEYQQALNRIQVYGRANGSATADAWAVGSSGALATGVDVTVACLIDFGTLVGYPYINGVASGSGGFGPNNGSMILDAADPINYVAVGGTMNGGAVIGSQIADCSVQRIGLMKLETMPSSISAIMLSLAACKGVPGRWIHPL